MPNEYYESANMEHFWVEWRFRVLRRMIPKDFDWKQTLDVGCGKGVTARQIQAYYGYSIAGCDLNPSSLSAASLENRPFYYYDITQRHNELKEVFSNILLLDVLEHIEDPISFLNAVHFHLKKGGRIIINVPAFQVFYSLYDAVQGHFRRYTILKLRKELKATHFCAEKAIYWGISLTPILFIRKFIMLFCPNEVAMKVGFRPASMFINNILKLIGRIETSLFLRPIFGTSLMVLARKEGY